MLEPLTDEPLTDEQLAEIEMVFAPPPPVTARFSPLAREQLYSHVIVTRLVAEIRRLRKEQRVADPGPREWGVWLESDFDGFEAQWATWTEPEPEPREEMTRAEAEKKAGFYSDDEGGIPVWRAEVRPYPRGER